MPTAHPRLIAQASIPSPLGPLLAAATADGLAGLWFDAQAHHPGALDAPTDADQRWISQARGELVHYWAADCARHAFTVPLDLHGTEFQRAVWQALLQITPGSTCTYGDIAQRIGKPAAVRAVGAAVGRNPVGILVPCHRVLGRDGSLTGYAGGLHRKQALLALEAA